MKRKFSVVALSIVLIVSLAACNASTVEAYINLAVQIALQVAQLAGVAPAVAGLVQTDLSTAETFYNSLASADAAAKPGILNKIDASLTTAQADLQNIFVTAHIADPKLQGTIRAALAIGITAIESVRTIMLGTQPAPNPVTAAARVALPGGTMPKSKQMSPKQLKALYNSTVADYPQARIK